MGPLLFRLTARSDPTVLSATTLSSEIEHNDGFHSAEGELVGKLRFLLIRRCRERDVTRDLVSSTLGAGVLSVEREVAEDPQHDTNSKQNFMIQFCVVLCWEWGI